MPQLFKNLARALLTSGITSGATSINIEPAKADLFPVADTGTSPVPATTDWFKMVLQDVTGAYEIVYVRTRAPASGVLSNVIRGQEGTTAAAWGAGTVAGVRLTALDIEQTISGVVPVLRGGTGSTTPGDARDALGATVVGDAVFTAADDEAARDALGASLVGDAVFTAADEAAARSAIGADVYKTLPIASPSTSFVSGEVTLPTASFTLNTGLTLHAVYTLFNSTVGNLTVTQGAGVTLELAGTGLQGTRTLASRAMATVWVRAANTYVISGPGVS